VTGVYGAGIAAYDLATGQERWRSEELTSSRTPFIDGQTVYVARGEESSPDPALVALELESGTERWRFADKSRYARESPIVESGVVYLLTAETSRSDPDIFLYAVDASTGSPRWQAELDGLDARGPVVSSGVVFVIDPYRSRILGSPSSPASTYGKRRTCRTTRSTYLNPWSPGAT
jgi:outer membrane protein assembly factor BamB